MARWDRAVGDFHTCLLNVLHVGSIDDFSHIYTDPLIAHDSCTNGNEFNTGLAVGTVELSHELFWCVIR